MQTDEQNQRQPVRFAGLQMPVTQQIEENKQTILDSLDWCKDNKVNLSSALGYYASATLRNDSLEKAESFNIGADIFESSK